MKLYLRIIYGWLKGGHSIDELDQAINEALTPFGFKQTGSSVDSMVRNLSFEADEFDIPADKKPGRKRRLDRIRLKRHYHLTDVV